MAEQNQFGQAPTTNDIDLLSGSETVERAPDEELYYILQQRNASPRAFELLQKLTTTIHDAQMAAATQQPTMSAVRSSAVAQLQMKLDECTGMIQHLAQRVHTVEVQPTFQRGNFDNSSKLSKLVAKQTPGKFDGNPSKLKDWKFQVQQFLDLSDVSSSNERARFAANLLESKALTWWRGYSTTSAGDPTTITLESLFESLESQFLDVDRELKLRRKLQDLKQHTSVQQYVSEFRKIQLELGTFALDDGAALFQFLQGLKDQVRTQVLLARPEDFEDAVLVAERADAAIMFAKGLSGGHYYNQKRGKYHGTYRNKPSHTPMELGNVGGGEHGGGSSKRGDKGNQRGKIVCYHCGRTGHIKRNCYKLNGDPRGKGKANVNVMDGVVPSESDSDHPKN